MPTATSPRRRPALAGSGLRGTTSHARYVYALVFVWGVGDVASTLVAAAVTGSPGPELNPPIRLLLQTEPLLVPVVMAVVLTAGVALFGFREASRPCPAGGPGS